MSRETFMREAIREAEAGMRAGRGGPFGCVIVRRGEIIARGSNRVTSTNDPTAHAEVTAIRRAAAALATYDLSGCEIYSSCEPCPMCLGAILWARLDRVWYAADQHQAASAGFDDSLFYRQMCLPHADRIVPMTRACPEHANDPFDAWAAFSAKVRY